jgi:hypothetical protein
MENTERVSARASLVQASSSEAVGAKTEYRAISGKNF